MHVAEVAANHHLAHASEELKVRPRQKVADEILVEPDVEAPRARMIEGDAELARGHSIVARLIDQRYALLIVEGQDFADENHVIPAGVLECVLALQPRRTAG